MLIQRFELDHGREPPKFGLGLKELWQVAPEKHQPGLVQHTFGWPLDDRTGGGSFLYHLDDGLVSVGFVMHLNYQNPWLSPFEEFQRFKTHEASRATRSKAPSASPTGARHHRGRLAVGAEAHLPRRRADRLRRGLRQRAAHQGQPQRDAVGHARRRACRGGAPEGRAHETTGMPATRRPGAQPTSAATCGRCATPSRCGRNSARRSASALRASTCGPIRSLGVSPFGTLGHGKPDDATLKPAAQCKRIAYPRPDGKITFDKLSSVFLSNTNHEEDQPPHLVVRDMALQKASEHDVYAGPSQRYCPAGVYEWVEEGGARATSSTRRTASTARPATSRIRTATSPGSRPKAAAGRTIRICEDHPDVSYVGDQAVIAALASFLSPAVLVLLTGAAFKDETMLPRKILDFSANHADLC